MTLKLHSTATIININEPLEHYKYIINTGILYCIASFQHKHCCVLPLLSEISLPHSRFPLPVAPGLTQGPCSLLPLGSLPKSLLFPASSDPCSLLHLVSLRVPATYCSFSSSSMASNCKNKERYSKYHPNQPCSKCFLCGKSSLIFSHYAAWGEDEKEFLRNYCENEPESSACICVAHQKEAKRTHPPQYSPNGASLSQYLLESTKSVFNHVVTPRRS